MNDQHPAGGNQQIEKGLAAFSFGQMQDFITMYKVMNENDISIEALEAYITDKQAGMAEIHRIQQNMPDCPICGKKLTIQPIHTPQGKQNIKGWKSLWHCIGEDCIHESYSAMTVAEELKRHGVA